MEEIERRTAYILEKFWGAQDGSNRKDGDKGNVQRWKKGLEGEERLWLCGRFKRRPINRNETFSHGPKDYAKTLKLCFLRDGRRGPARKKEKRHTNTRIREEEEEGANM